MTLISSFFYQKLGSNLIRPLSKFQICCSTSRTTTRTFVKIGCPQRSKTLSYKADNTHICAYHTTTRNNFPKPLSRTYSKDASEPDDDKPITYSTSKAKDWTVGKSFGADRKPYPRWLVATISLTLSAVLIWAFVREETEIDEILGANLHEQLEKINPNLKVAEPGTDPRIAR